MTKINLNDFYVPSNNTTTQIKHLSGNFLEIPCKLINKARIFIHLQQECKDVIEAAVDYENKSPFQVFFWEHIGENYYELFNVISMLSGIKEKKIFFVVDDSYEGLLTKEKISEIYSAFENANIEHCVVTSNYKITGKNIFHYNFNLIYKTFDNIDMVHDFHTKNIKKRSRKFLCLNRQTRFHRLETVDFLLKHNLEKDSYISIGKDGLDIAQNNSNDLSFTQHNHFNLKPVLDKTLIDRKLKKESIRRLHASLPISLDINENMHEPRHLPNPVNFFDDSYWSIITERDFYTSQYIGYTEKVLKAFLYRHPFVVVGLPHTLKILRDMGFLTFSSIIDESYDAEEDHDKRMLLIQQQIKRLADLDYVDHFNLYHKITDILEHNRKHFINLNERTRPVCLINKLHEWIRFSS